MRKVLVLTVAVFVGALAALQIDHWVRRDQAHELRTTESLRGIDGFGVRPVNLESAVAAPVDFRAAVKKIMPAVVSVDSTSTGRGFFGEAVAQRSSGSGVVISSDGNIITNHHVVAGATQVRVHFSDGRSMDARIVGSDPRSDIAVLKVNGKDLPAAEIGSSAALEIGEWVIAAGNPLGYENTVSVGVVSSLGRTLPTEGAILVDAIQTDAAINQGNSGGALANARGQLVGINSAIASNTGGSVGIGFAIPIDRAKRIVKDLIATGRVRYGWLGIQINPQPVLANAGDRQALSEMVGAMPPSEGLLIQRVVQGSPAARLGIQRFDVLLAIDGKKIVEATDFQKQMIDRKPGDQISLKYWSRGTTKTIQVTLEDLTTAS